MTCHADDILLVKLQKKLNPTDSVRFDHIDYQYDALGYYDYVGFSFVNEYSDLASKSVKGMVGGEHSILIPVSDRGISFDAHPMGIISYFMVDEDENTDLLVNARKIETAMGLNCKAYITMGASAIAVLRLYSDVENVIKCSRDHIIELQNHPNDWNDVMYTFSITFFTQDCMQHKCEMIHSVYISFAWKAQHADRAEKVLAAIGTQLNAKNYKTGVIPGTDDFFIHAINVPFNSFIVLYGRDGILASEKNNNALWYGKYCDSTYTVIGYEFQGDDFKTCATSESIQTIKGTSYRISTILNTIKEYENTGMINSMLDSFASFQALNTSKYTSWVYRHYLPIVELFSSLIEDEFMLATEAEQFRDDNVIAIISEEAVSFFDVLDRMLGALLNTSAYLTDSPGYRTIERNWIPRLLLCYQKIINTLVTCWDAAYPKPGIERKHAFILCVQDGAEPQANMYFPQLPPDKRVINIMIPLFQAYQPAMLLPLLLHEAGHYVGVRLRSNPQNLDQARDKFFIHLVTNMFIREMLELMFGNTCDNLAKCFNDPVNYVKMYGEYIDCEPSEYVAEVIHAFLSMYEYHEIFERYIADEYYAYKRKFMECRIGSPKSEMEWRRKYAIESNYFSEMRKIMRTIINGILDDGEVEFSRVFERHIGLCIDQEPEKKRFYNRILAGIVKRVRFAIQDCMIHLAAQDGSDFISKSEWILSEIAADMFMVHGVQMSADLYLCITFEQYARKKIPVKDILMMFSLTPNAHSRVVAVYSVLSNRRYGEISSSGYIEESMARIAQLHGVGSDEVHACFADFCKWIKNKKHENEEANGSCWTVQIERMLSPISISSAYAKLLFDDDRYADSDDIKTEVTEEKKKLQRVIRKIRMIYKNACNINADQNTLSSSYRLMYEKL